MQMILLITHLFLLLTTYATDTNDPLLEELFPHFQFSCDPSTDAYETEFSFLQGSAHGFVHVESNRVFFEYYFPAQHWVAFSTADQVISNQKDQCSLCYFTNYYPLSPTNKNHSNLYPKCIEECLDDCIFVATVNSDEENIETWSIIEFQVATQQSKSFQKKMYRIPQQKDLLEIWGEEDYPYRQYSHFETEIISISVSGEEKDFVHARFWREYNYGDNTAAANEWKPFVVGPYHNTDTFCFISIGSFYGGEYPYNDDAMHGKLPGFYIDTQHLANIHCYKTNDIKLNCGEEIRQNDDYDDETNPENKMRTDDLGDDESEDIGELNMDEKEEILKKDLLDPNTGCFLDGPITNRFIANCADDNCEKYPSLDSAIDKCLEESSCTGVVQIVSGQSIYQLRSDKLLRDSPRGEVTWVKLCGEKALARIKEIAAETNPENKMRTDDLVDNNGNIQNKYKEYVAKYDYHTVKSSETSSHIHSTMKPTAKPTVTNNDNKMTSYWIQETIQRKDFDVIIGSHDFTFINFGAEWSIYDKRFAPSWSEAEDKSNGMIFNDKNGQQISVKLLHINCVTSQDLCGSIGIRAYPTVRLYRRFVTYHGERKVASILDFVKHFVESETVPIKSEIKSDNNLDGTDYEQYLDGTDDDTVEYDGNAFESVNYSYYYGGILIVCIAIIGVIILYWICFNKKQTDKQAKQQILMYDSTTIQTNFGEQEGI